MAGNKDFLRISQIDFQSASTRLLDQSRPDAMAKFIEREGHLEFPSVQERIDARMEYMAKESGLTVSQRRLRT